MIMLSCEQLLFLDILSSSLQNKKYDLSAVIQAGKPQPDIAEIIRLARIHKVTPMICDAICQTLGIRDSRIYCAAEKEAIRAVVGQALRTAQFSDLYKYMSEKGLRPIVVKGIIIRQLYPHNYFRASVDEDLWIDRGQARDYADAFFGYGLETDLHEEISEGAGGAFVHPSTKLILDIHVNSFLKRTEEPMDLEDYVNELFSNVTDVTMDDVTYRTPDFTEHLLYLIFHVLKHFLYSGFGIRQICDIILFSEHYRDLIEWERVIEKLKSAHAYEFALAVCKIGDRYLLRDNHLKECFISDEHHVHCTSAGEAKRCNWDSIDEEPLLHDILEGGLYGSSSLVRLHSSNITLHAIKDNMGKRDRVSGKSGKSKGAWIKDHYSNVCLALQSVFLPLKSMEGRYPYLKKASFLLPAAWLHRIMHFLRVSYGRNKDGRGKENNRQHGCPGRKMDDAFKSISLGRERIRLLERYHIIE